MGKVLVAYAGKTGTTEHCAELLCNRLRGSLYNLNKETPDLKDFDTVVIGGSIRMGIMQKKAKLFMEEHEQELLDKKLGVFICCCEENKVPVLLAQNVLPSLRKHAVFTVSFGGKLDRSRIHGFDRCFATVMMRSPAFAAFNQTIFKDRIKECAELLREPEE